MAIKTEIENYGTKIANAKTIVDNAYIAEEISEIDYNIYYPKLAEIESTINTFDGIFDNNIGYKSAGNYITTNNLFDDADKTMNEIMRANNKYSVKESCDEEITNGINYLKDSLDLFDNLPSMPDFINFTEVFQWLDDNINFNTDLSTLKGYVDTVISSMTTIKEKVNTYLTEIKRLGENISIASSQLLAVGNPCLDNIISKTLTYKTQDDLDFIEDFKTSDSVTVVTDTLELLKL